MGRFIGGILLPLLLLTASLLYRSLISMVNLLAFLLISFSAPTIGSCHWRWNLVSYFVIAYSVLIIFSHAIVNIIISANGEKWENEFGMSLCHVYFLVMQLLGALIAILDIYWSTFMPVLSRYPTLQHLLVSLEETGSRLRVLSCMLVPVVQLVAGITHPSGVSLPFFICSCIGLVDWSLTGNFLGFLRWWRYLLFYAGFNIVILYAYQLPIELSSKLQWIANFIGLYKISSHLDWSHLCSGISLLLFYFMLCSIRCDLLEMDVIMSMKGSSITEQLIPKKHFLISEYRSGARHTNILLRRTLFRTFTINYFTYGYPISLLALSFWSIQYASLCSFGLIVYLGYLLYTSPSLYFLHRLNVFLLVFVLLWAICTYLFNLAFTILDQKMLKDMEVWETIGLWRYPVPGSFLLAQFCLGILVGMSILVRSSVFLYLSDKDEQTENGYCSIREKEETAVLIVAIVAWMLRKSSRAIVLVLIFSMASRPGFFHALYMTYFMIYLLRRTISRKIRQSLILFCEVHFALLYILGINLIAKSVEQRSRVAVEILSHLGLLQHTSSVEYLKIASLACFCAICNNGFDMFLSYSAVVQDSPFPPIGWNILQAGLKRSFLSSVYFSTFHECGCHNSSHDSEIASYINAIGRKIHSAYRSCGTYIVCLTVLLTIYLVKPNYASFGYLFFLLLWMNGRQLVGKTIRHLWFPLKLYAVAVFALIYCLGIFPSLKTWFSGRIDLYQAFGYDPDASLLRNVREPLAILVVMQLYSFERSLNNSYTIDDFTAPHFGKVSIFKRLLIWHSEKILLLALFYASLSPISAFGFVYLLGMVICSAQPKPSRLASKFFLIYSGFVLMVLYLFQLLGEKAEMFPGQRNSYLSFILGLGMFRPGFFGLESGMRGEVLVIMACVLQYNVFHWLDVMASNYVHRGNCEEEHTSFPATYERPDTIPFGSNTCNASVDVTPLLEKEKEATRNSHSISDDLFQVPEPVNIQTENMERNYTRTYSYNYGRENSKENHKWNRKWIVLMRKERQEMQKDALKLYMKYMLENIFSIFGLEINMIALVLASFAVLNVVSLIYIGSLAACVLIPRHVIRRLWPIFVLSFLLVLTLEYLSIWLNITSWKEQPLSEAKMACHDCWKNSDQLFDYCRKCWLGTIVDDPRMLISYFMVFLLACFKHRADHLFGLSELHMYQQLKQTSLLGDLSFDTKSMWTSFDNLRLYGYCHLLDLVLALIMITGTLEYDILHLGYLAFALAFFRMRFEILKKKNKIFKFLRMYNFAVIAFSLAYQSPFIGDSNEEKCETINYIYEVIGFHKYDYGFRITSRSAFVEIMIFMLVSLQSYMFASQEFDYVAKYLEAEQLDGFVREQEKRASWKTAQLHYIRKSEEKKRLRNSQVEKMKSEMFSLQMQLHNMNSGDTLPKIEGTRKKSFFDSYKKTKIPEKEKNDFEISNEDSVNLFPSEPDRSLESVKSSHPEEDSTEHSVGSSPEGNELKDRSPGIDLWDLEKRYEGDFRGNKTRLASAANLFGHGVSHVKSLGNKAVSNLVNYLNIKYEEPDILDYSSENDIYYELENQNIGFEPSEQALSVQSASERNLSQNISHVTKPRISVIFYYMLAQIRSNNDIVCYCLFVLMFLWNFSLLSTVYLAALYLFALCVNTGPGYMFWVMMLIYSEVCILLQYLYQIIIQHCGFRIHFRFLKELGFPDYKIQSSFVISIWPLFLLYIFTLFQSSISARDGGWTSVTEFSSQKRRGLHWEESSQIFSWWERLYKPLQGKMQHIIKSMFRYWNSVTQGAEAPPYFVQLSMEVNVWPDDGIQPERIESGLNRLLEVFYDLRCKERVQDNSRLASRVRVQSIERSPENLNIALAVFEVVYASPSEPVLEEWSKSLTPAADVAEEILDAQCAGIFQDVGFPYPVISVIGGGKREIDLYAYVFCAELAVFFLVAIFYESVIKNKSEFFEVYQLEDQFPKEFVLILLILFSLIVLDRIIYLCSFATGKVIFYLFTLVLFTSYAMKYAWSMEPSHQRAGRLALRAIFLTKAISLALQAAQIRYGIPRESTLYRQFLTARISQLNFLGYRMYRALPFLYELRCVLDWSCTSTSLTMYDWLKLEDIYSSLFLVKCDVDLNRATHRHGQKQPKMTKFCNGICVFLVLVFVIWAPMLMYSSGNPSNIANPIKDASVQIDLHALGGRLSLFQTTLCKKISWDEVDVHVNLDPHGYLTEYNKQDVQLICCQADASTSWLVPPVVQYKFAQSLKKSMKLVFSWKFTRNRPKGKEVVKYDLHIDERDLPRPEEVIGVLNGSVNTVRIRNLYPKYFRVTGSGDVRLLEEAVNMFSGDLSKNHGYPEWWSFHDVDASEITGCGELAGPMAIIVSEETPQGIIGETLSKFSIWSLYITFVLAVGRFIRLQCSDLRMRIPYENLPSCDRLLAICEKIYAARAEGELEVEEVLYWTLVEIYRSPHKLIEYTKLE
ncbi:hypothetical protein DCAR_0623937 [Daucus carota subsp. sativus]|uniref:Piezo non-specific cation channel R-Ras-binding domain-containing protein n=1 Tax=Daucus carota subsp. sativus TaxID=79200 RepID=A0AAF0XAX4_DAUCS|nr:hypothetical protein DCAR_0623937 [Daucus carota subsp. sativus]